MTPVQGTYYLTADEYRRYARASERRRKSQAEVDYYEALARLRQVNGHRMRGEA